MRRSVLLLAALLALAACGSGASAGTADGAGVDGQWQLRSGTADGVDVPIPPGRRATLDLTGGEARGDAFCNLYFASYTRSGSSLSIGGIAQTERGCEPDVSAADSAYFAALAAVDTAMVDAGQLVLTGDGVELRYTPVAPVPQAQLAGTRWLLESLVDEDVASSVVGEARLALAPDGTAAVTTGCDEWTATWRLEGNALVLDAQVVSVGCDAPEHLAAQDRHVAAVLDAGPTAVVDGDRLTLTALDGRGLVYRAT